MFLLLQEAAIQIGKSWAQIVQKFVVECPSICVSKNVLSEQQHKVAIQPAHSEK